MTLVERRGGEMNGSSANKRPAARRHPMGAVTEPNWKNPRKEEITIKFKNLPAVKARRHPRIYERDLRAGRRRLRLT